MHKLLLLGTLLIAMPVNAITLNEIEIIKEKAKELCETERTAGWVSLFAAGESTVKYDKQCSERVFAQILEEYKANEKVKNK